MRTATKTTAFAVATLSYYFPVCRNCILIWAAAAVADASLATFARNIQFVFCILNATNVCVNLLLWMLCQCNRERCYLLSIHMSQSWLQPQKLHCIMHARASCLCLCLCLCLWLSVFPSASANFSRIWMKSEETMQQWIEIIEGNKQH